MRIKLKPEHLLAVAALGVGWVLWNRYKAAHYTAPTFYGDYFNPIGETDNYRGATLPSGVRGGQ